MHIYIFLFKNQFNQNFVSFCWDKLDYPGSIVYLSFFKKSLFTIAVINLATRVPLYTCLVPTVFIFCYTSSQFIPKRPSYLYSSTLLIRSTSSLVILLHVRKKEQSMKFKNILKIFVRLIGRIWQQGTVVSFWDKAWILRSDSRSDSRIGQSKDIHCWIYWFVCWWNWHIHKSGSWPLTLGAEILLISPESLHCTCLTCLSFSSKRE